MEGSCLTCDRARCIYETSTAGIAEEHVNADDVMETVHPFRCVGPVSDAAKAPLTEMFIKGRHA